MPRTRFGEHGGRGYRSAALRPVRSTSRTVGEVAGHRVADGAGSSGGSTLAAGRRVLRRRPPAPASASTGCGTGIPTAGRPGSARRPGAGSARAAARGRGRGSGSADSSAWVYGWAGLLEDLVAGADLDDLAEVHHRHPVGDVAHHRQVVGDEEVGEAELVLQLLEQVHDAGLDATRRAPTPARRARSAPARGRAPGRCRRAGAGRRRTRAG